MDQEETRREISKESSSQKEIERLDESLRQISSELSAIKANVKKRKSAKRN